MPVFLHYRSCVVSLQWFSIIYSAHTQFKHIKLVIHRSALPTPSCQEHAPRCAKVWQIKVVSVRRVNTRYADSSVTLDDYVPISDWMLHAIIRLDGGYLHSKTLIKSSETSIRWYPAVLMKAGSEAGDKRRIPGEELLKSTGGYSVIIKNLWDYCVHAFYKITTTPAFYLRHQIKDISPTATNRHLIS